MFSALHECGHVSMWRQESVAPKPGERITCARCGLATKVKELFGPWRAQCLDCTRVNGHATFTATVVATATRHVQEWTTHRVQVWRYGDRESIRIYTSRATGSQPALFTDAPF